MRFVSTRGGSPPVSFRQAVMAGLAPDGGLYLPAELPRLPDEVLDAARDCQLAETAARVAAPFVGDELPPGVLEAVCADAFDLPLPVVPVAGGVHVLELFWGPTFAFKDFGARFLARVVDRFAAAGDRRLTILVATSGDTGSAVAHGFAGMAAVDVVLLYPSGRVSRLQEQQLTTVGGNVAALEVAGTFDDCQAMVKAAFADAGLRRRRRLSSANSINIGRLLPQLCYAVHAVGQLPGVQVLAVPSGNFGNLTGALMGRLMGLPLERLVAGTNANDVVPRFLAGGELAPRPVIRTPASAMDVGDPSNLDRIRALLGDDLERIRQLLWGTSVATPEILATIAGVRRRHGYLLDPHSAVGWLALERYLAGPGDAGRPSLLAATAHPGKFSEAIRAATGEEVEIPRALAAALERPKQATAIVARPAALREYLLDTV